MQSDMQRGHIARSATTKHANDNHTRVHSPCYKNESRLTPTISVENFCSDETYKSRPESRNSISSISSEPDYLTIQEILKSKDRRSKSADTYPRKSVHSKQTVDMSCLRKVSSENILSSIDNSKECRCTCSSAGGLVNTGVSGSQLVSFYSLWRNNQKRTLGKKLEIPSYMKRKSDYRECGCKTRLYEKKCSEDKSEKCCCHDV
ncbi:unnamed protein product [Mytilus edulis]|uniref:Uncharacterized protein n=2 Tax=Mytilus TaxID=6548 RepID=A0A8B6HA47_MYTGA|nr:unnamed protein product [Mytilus edulis]VDI76382.1 Hypothetical predicted protein [Mytilus galloprovincialis]